MEKEFVPYPLALIMKALGFDEPCFGGWSHPFENNKNGFLQLNQECEYDIEAPTYHQAFKWFRDEHKLDYSIIKNDLTKKYRISDILLKNKYIELEEDFEDREYKLYEQAELACLEKLLDIV